VNTAILTLSKEHDICSRIADICSSVLGVRPDILTPQSNMSGYSNVVCLVGTGENGAKAYTESICQLYDRDISMLPITFQGVDIASGPERLNHTLGYIWSKHHIINAEKHDIENELREALSGNGSVYIHQNNAVHLTNNNIVHKRVPTDIFALILTAPIQWLIFFFALMFQFAGLISLSYDGREYSGVFWFDAEGTEAENPIWIILWIVFLLIVALLCKIPWKNAKRYYDRFGPTILSVAAKVVAGIDVFMAALSALIGVIYLIRLFIISLV